MLKLTKRIFMNKTFKNKMKQQISSVLTQHIGPAVRNAPQVKQRKFKNIEITQDFKKLEQKRKRQRNQNMKKRQQLLQQKLRNQAKLLSGPQTQIIKQQITSIQQSIQSMQTQLKQLDDIIQNTEASHIVIEGTMKLTVINHIKYIQYLHSNNPGYTLHPETIKAIENVHYCVNHNLPVNRISLYEIMPEFFEAEVGELEDSVQRLIMEKQLFVQDQDTKSSIRFFHKLDHYQNQFENSGFLQQEKQQTFQAIYDYCHQLLSKHQQFFQKVQQGRTPFRSLSHLVQVMLSDMPINYLPQQQQLRKDILQVAQIQKQWLVYKQKIQQEIINYDHRYIQPPPYIKNHPVLSKRYEQIMKLYTNPVPVQKINLIPTGDTREAELGQKMEQQIRKIVQEKYDPLFIEAMNGDRSKIDKKKLEIQFYNLSTNIYENLQALEHKTNDQEQLFEKTPKEQSMLLGQRRKNLLKMDELTRMLMLNNKDKNKYNLQFFSKWFGVDKNELANMLKYVSYLRVFQQHQKNKQTKQTQKTTQDVKFQILKFQM